MLAQESVIRFVNKQIQREEGYRQFLYNDKTGEEIELPPGATIAIGLNIAQGISLELAQVIATYFVKKNDAQLSKDLDFYDKLDDVRKCVIIDMSYNMGVHGAEAFTQTLNLVREGFYANAASQLRKTEVYKQLPHRYEPLCVELETGNWMPGV